jgi:hydrogenase/urease accessory protein HupE
VVANALLRQPSKPRLGEKDDFLKLTVTRTENGRAVATDAGLLAATHTRYHFFAPLSSVVLHFWRLGLEHIGFGADHLLFLLALLASRIDMRRWIVLLTTFTVAPGLTFAIASNGGFTLSSTVVEPAIAVSIVVIAGLHLTRFKPSLSMESAFVFGCGLIHGLGFAAAMQDQSLNEQRPIWSIVGFNLGVETGQLSVALLIFIVTYGARRLPVSLVRVVGCRGG